MRFDWMRGVVWTGLVIFCLGAWIVFVNLLARFAW